MMHHPRQMGPIEARLYAAAMERKRRFSPAKPKRLLPTSTREAEEAATPDERVIEYTQPVVEKREKRQRNPVPMEQIRALTDMGYPQYQIAEMVGCGASSVSRALTRDRGGKPVRRMITDYRARIEALFDEGVSLAEIAARFDFCPSSVSKFIAREGWKR